MKRHEAALMQIATLHRIHMETMRVKKDDIHLQEVLRSLHCSYRLLEEDQKKTPDLPELPDDWLNNEAFEDERVKKRT